MVLDHSVRNHRNPAVSLCRRRSGDALVELAAASAVWLANAWLLASAGIAGLVPDPVWRTRPRRTRRPARPPLRSWLPQYVPGRAREVPQSDGGRLRLRLPCKRQGNAVGASIPCVGTAALGCPVERSSTALTQCRAGS